MEEEITLQDVGEDLLRESRAGEFSARGVLPALFPFIHGASKRMSTRAISRWLKEAHGIKLSAVSIAKALRNPEKYWEALADEIEPAARAVEEASDVSMESFLFDEDTFRFVEQKRDGLVLDIPEGGDPSDAFGEYEANLTVLGTKWWALEQSARDSCRRYLTGEREEESDAK